ITTKKGKKTTGPARILGVSFSSNVTTGFIDKSTFPKYQEQYGAGYGPYYSDGEYPGLYEYDYDGDGTPDLVVPSTEDASQGEAFDPDLMVYQYDAFYPTSPTYNQKTPWVYPENGPIKFFETPWIFNNNIDITGGGEVTTFRLSYTNTDQSGIMPNSSLKKNNFLFNGSYDVLDNLKVTAQANYVNTYAKGRNSTGYSDNIISSFRQWWQTNVDLETQKELYFLNGDNISWNPKSENNLTPIYWDNPYWVRYKNYQNDNRDRLIAYTQVDWKITDYLSIMGRAAIDTYDEMQEERKAVGSVAGELGVGRPEVTSGYARYQRKFRETNFDLMGRFNKYLTEDFNLTALLGTNIRRTMEDELYGSTDGGLIIPGLYSISNSLYEVPAPAERVEEIGVNGIFAGLSMGYKDLLYLDANIRRDQSSTLPDDEDIYYYPSVSGSVLFHNLLEGATWMQLGKFRLGYAQVGNDAPWGALIDTYDNNGLFNGVPMYSLPIRKANENLKPERTTELETGLEMIFAQNRLGLDLSLYQRNTIDQIIPVAVSFATGYSGKWLNAGEMENKGIELALRGTPVLTRDFKWDIQVNWSTNKNEVISLAEGLENLQLAGLQGGVTINARVGEPYGTIQGTDFVYDDNGNKIIRSNGYYMRTETSDIVLGDINPDWNAGISNTLSYKDWSFSFLVDMQEGGSLFSLDLWYGMATGLYEETAFINDLGNPVRDPIVGEPGNYDPTSGGYILEGVLEDGTPNTMRIPGNNYAAFGYATSPNARYVYDASYIKLREVVLSYSIPKAKLANSFIKGASFSLVGSNLWIIAKDLPHADPEASQGAGNIQGWQSGVMPTVKNVGLTVNLQF
ncbi:MAG: hypothetical protein ACLFPE_04085, partial [Bacteroidales bacterium]